MARAKLFAPITFVLLKGLQGIARFTQTPLHSEKRDGFSLIRECPYGSLGSACADQVGALTQRFTKPSSSENRMSLLGFMYTGFGRGPSGNGSPLGGKTNS